MRNEAADCRRDRPDGLNGKKYERICQIMAVLKKVGKHWLVTSQIEDKAGIGRSSTLWLLDHAYRLGYVEKKEYSGKHREPEWRISNKGYRV